MTRIRPNPPRDYAEAVKKISDYVCHYKAVRLHGSIGYITPADCLAGLTDERHAELDRKLEEARFRRRENASLAIAS